LWQSIWQLIQFSLRFATIKFFVFAWGRSALPRQTADAASIGLYCDRREKPGENSGRNPKKSADCRKPKGSNALRRRLVMQGTGTKFGSSY
jgi:hypothetical protein